MTFFDKFAERASRIVSHAPFFTFCVLLVLTWAPSILVFRNLDTWQLIINTTTTIITFLMVALLENSTRQFENAVNQKLDAQTRGIAIVLHLHGDDDAASALLKTLQLEKKVGT